MSRSDRNALTRRVFVGGMAALPALWSAARADPEPPPSIRFRRLPPPVTSADQVLDVAGFEALARDVLPPAHFGYVATGADDDLTVARNHDAFGHYEIRAHRFNDLSHFDLSRAVYGLRWPSPLYLSAVSSMRAFHPDAEVGVARAAASRGLQLMVSTGSSAAVEDVRAARAGSYWQQLYPTDDWSVTDAIIARAERNQADAIVLTVDSHGPRNSQTLRRAMLVDSRTCTDCHVANSHDMWHKAPMFSGIDVSHVTGLTPPDMTPSYLDKLRRRVRGRLILKGVVTAEDAALGVAHGADGIIVSNHGGRNEETLRATIDCLPEVVAAVRGRVPVFLDGGVRRGTDIFKALALGASGVGIGRPQAWGLAAFGQSGVESVIDILHRELAQIMHQAGTATVAAISARNVVRRIEP